MLKTIDLRETLDALDNAQDEFNYATKEAKDECISQIIEHEEERLISLAEIIAKEIVRDAYLKGGLDFDDNLQYLIHFDYSNVMDFAEDLAYDNEDRILKSLGLER